MSQPRHDTALLEDGFYEVSPWQSVKRWRILTIIAGVVILGLTIGLIIAGVQLHSEPSSNFKPKNLIFFIGDGFGPASQTLARMCLNKSRLALDNYQIGLVNTYSSSSVITDSAAGATAYSCAQKTYNYAIAVDNNRKPCGTVLEAAIKKNKRTGMVVTSRLTHATPAAFSSHSVDRNYEDFIAGQQIEHKFDIMLGGGADIFRAHEERARQLGYNIIYNKTELEDTSRAKLPLLGLFARSHMSYEIDRDPNVEPSLSEMLQHALDLLNKDNKEGFVLLVEGSRIDHAGHSNDIAAHLHDIISFNEAFQTAVNFAMQDEQTTVISTADHETGGLVLARTNFTLKDLPGPWVGNAFPKIWYPEVINRVNMSTERMTELYRSNNMNLASFKQLVFEQTGQSLSDESMDRLRFLVESGTEKLNSSLASRFEYTLSEIISAPALISWATHDHSSVNVVLYGYNAPGLNGVNENNAVGEYVTRIFDLDLAKVTEEIAGFDPNPPKSLAKATLEEYHRHV
jgi:alkaline phosphatase